jgi:hypothetical protein
MITAAGYTSIRTQAAQHWSLGVMGVGTPWLEGSWAALESSPTNAYISSTGPKSVGEACSRLEASPRSGARCGITVGMKRIHSPTVMGQCATGLGEPSKAPKPTFDRSGVNKALDGGSEKRRFWRAAGPLACLNS